jgi:hypothetical protein
MLMGRVCAGAGILIKMRLAQGLGWLTVTENLLHCAVRDSFPLRAMIRKLMALRTLIVADFGIAGAIVGTMRSRQLVLP